MCGERRSLARSKHLDRPVWIPASVENLFCGYARPSRALLAEASLEQVLSASVSARRFNTLLLDLFAVVAVTLAAVGIYGTVAYWVAQRMREIGVRMALGATRGAIAALIVGHSLKVTACGVAIGIAAAAVASRVLETLLFKVSAIDPFTFVGGAVTILAIGAAAAYVPARRATRGPPLPFDRPS